MFKYISLSLALFASCILLADESKEWADAMSIKAVDTKPIPIKQTAPVIPKNLKGIEGVIHVSFVIDTEGKVPAAKVLKSTNESLNEVAIKTVKKWEFKPATNVGVAIPVRAIVPLRFK